MLLFRRYQASCLCLKCGTICWLWAIHFALMSHPAWNQPPSLSVPSCCAAVLCAVTAWHQFINSVIHHLLPLLSHKTRGLCLCPQPLQFLKPSLIHSGLRTNVCRLRQVDIWAIGHFKGQAYCSSFIDKEAKTSKSWATSLQVIQLARLLHLG